MNPSCTNYYTVDGPLKGISFINNLIISIVHIVYKEHLRRKDWQMKNPRYVVFSVIRQILTCQLITIQVKQALKMEKQCVRN